PSRRERPISRLARCRSADGAEPVSDERPVTGHPAERDTSRHKASVSQSLDIRGYPSVQRLLRHQVNSLTPLTKHTAVKEPAVLVRNALYGRPDGFREVFVVAHATSSGNGGICIHQNLHSGSVQSLPSSRVAVLT